jgi:hypothetical protein
VICTTCGAEIADKAIVCYRCGAPTALPAAPVRRPPPRRPWAAIVVLLVLAIAAIWMAIGAAAASLERPAGWIAAVLLALAAVWLAVRRR